MKDIKLLEKAWTEYVESGAKIDPEELGAVKSKLTTQLALDFITFLIKEENPDELMVKYFIRGVETGIRYQEMMELKEVLEK